MSETEFRLVFRASDERRVNEMATKLRSRAAELGGLLSFEVHPVISDVVDDDLCPRLVGEDDATYSQRLARARAEEAERRKIAAEGGTAVEPLAKFQRVWG